jgi:hypothetical protein
VRFLVRRFGRVAYDVFTAYFIDKVLEISYECVFAHDVVIVANCRGPLLNPRFSSVKDILLFYFENRNNSKCFTTLLHKLNTVVKIWVLHTKAPLLNREYLS